MAKKAKEAKQAKQHLVVTVSPGRPIHEVTHDLKAAGFKVNEVLDTIGVVTGSANADHLAKLKAVRGVADVSPDHDVDIGPPGAIS
jgi:hypothetical protein